MANKEKPKVLINRARFDETLKLRGSSIRKLGQAYNEIGRDEKSIRRYLREGFPTDILDLIGKYLDVEPAYLSGKYDKEIEKIKDPDLRDILKRQLRPNKFPYLMAQTRQQGFYDRYFESILTIHGISEQQFSALTPGQQKQLRLDMEAAITHVISKFFTEDAKGQKGLPDLEYLYAMIDNYDPDEPEQFDDAYVDMDDNDPFEDKYSLFSNEKETNGTDF